jgi:spore germination protein KC
MRNTICLIIIFLLCSLSGCSNYKELNQIAIVLGMGVDYIPSKHLYEVVFQLVNPSENAANGMSSGGTPVVTITTTGKTISEAARNASKQISRQHSYSHIELIIIGEQLAKKESLNYVFDTFERDAGIRVNVPVLIARDVKVRTAMDILPSLDKVPVKALVGKVKNASNLLGEYGETKVYEIIEQLTSLGTEAAINGISVVGDKNEGIRKENLESMEKVYVTLKGIAIFRKGKLVGWMDGKKTKSLQIIHNKLKQTNLRIHCNETRYNSVLVNSLRSHPKVDIRNNQVMISIQANAFGNIDEVLCNKDLSKRKVMNEFEHSAERELEKEIKEGILAAQKLKSDVFGFGEILHYTHLGKWNKSKLQWNELFSKAKVNVQVHMDIEGTGMRIKPYPY